MGMRYALFLIALFVTCLQPLAAQQPEAADSVYFWRFAAADNLWRYRSITQLTAAPLVSGQVALVRSAGKGGFKGQQQAYEASSAGFRTEGISKMGRFYAAGHFSYAHDRADSMGYTLKGAAGSVYQPYYLFAGKAGAYRMIDYTFGGILGYLSPDNRWSAGSGFSYRSNNTTRSVDPRPQVNFFRVTVEPEVSFAAGNHRLGLSARWGYGNETNGITYKSDKFGGDLSNPGRIPYLIYGYADYEITAANKTFQRNQQYYGGAVHYFHERGEVRLRAKAGYTLDREANVTLNFHQEKGENFMDFSHHRGNADLLWTKAGARANQQVELLALYEWGENVDNRPQYMRSTYTFDAITARLAYGWQSAGRGRHHLGLGGGAESELTRRSDAVAGQELSTGFVRPFVRGDWYMSGADSRWSFHAEGGRRLTVRNAMEVPELQPNYFTRNVIFPDYYYHSSGAYTGMVSAQYRNHTLIRKFVVGASASLRMERAIRPADFAYPLPETYGNTRMWINLGIHLYL